MMNSRKNIFFVKSLNFKNGKNTSNADIQNISDVSAGVAYIICDSLKMRNLFNGRYIAISIDASISCVTNFLLNICDWIFFSVL